MAFVKSGCGDGAIKRARSIVSGEGHSSGEATAGPYIIGIAGGSASGKTTLCNAIVERLNLPWVVSIPLDAFYRELSPAENEAAARGDFDFDAPEALDWAAIRSCLTKLRARQRTEVPRYDFTRNAPLPTSDPIDGAAADVVLVEGILALHDASVRQLFDMKLFVDTDSDERFARRMLRDVRERGRQMEGIVNQYLRYVKSGYDRFIAPTRYHADVILPFNAANQRNPVGVGLLVERVRSQLELRGIEFRALSNRPSAENSKVTLAPQTDVVKAQANKTVESDGSSALHKSPPTMASETETSLLGIALLEQSSNKEPLKTAAPTVPQGSKPKVLGKMRLKSPDAEAEQKRRVRWAPLLTAIAEAKAAPDPYGGRPVMMVLHSDPPPPLKAADADVHKIDHNLFLGAETVACSETVLRELGVTHILTVEPWLGLPEYAGITYKRLHVLDMSSQPIHRHFVSSSKFISDAIAGGGTVFVHCQAGISRSPTIVIAHLMRRDHLTFAEAFARVKARRRRCGPNPGFEEQLRAFERSCANNRRHKARKSASRTLFAALLPFTHNKRDAPSVRVIVPHILRFAELLP